MTGVHIFILCYSIGGSSLEFNNSAQTSSPFIQSKPEAYTAYVAEVMGGRSEVDFRELLPAGATKKTASVAFSHILGEWMILLQRITGPLQSIIALPESHQFTQGLL